MLKAVVFPKHTVHRDGLEEARLHHLEKIVVLAGQNGAGKSRYLNLLKDSYESIAHHKHMRGFHVKQELAKIQTELDSGVHKENNLPISGETRARHEKRIEQVRLLDEYVDWIASKADLAEFLKPHKFINLTCFPMGVIADPTGMTPQDLGGHQGTFVNTPSGQKTYELMHVVAYQAARALWLGKHDDHREREDVKKTYQRAESLASLVQKMVGKVFAYDYHPGGLEPQPTLNGRHLLHDNLSPGQRILLTWALLLWQHSDQARNNVIIVDEPEKHLHPEAAVKAISALSASDFLGPTGQLWIATHSLPVIAAHGTRSLWFVEDGSIRSARDHFQQGIEGLLGGADGRRRLANLMAGTDEVAAAQFASECITDATVAGGRHCDPQLAQIADAIQGNAISVLDYGAGMGRLASELRRRMQSAKGEKPAVRYVAFEQNQTYLEQLRAAAAELDGEVVVQAGDITGLFSHVVFCNVLHEIPIGLWREVFADICRHLAGEGLAIIVEDQQLPVGELPHPDGFLLLTPGELKVLFLNADGISIDERQEGRLTACILTKSALASFDESQLRNVLHKVKNRAKLRIREVREAENLKPFQRGHLSMLYTTLLANVELAIDRLGISEEAKTTDKIPDAFVI